jgi:hypothetical protein
LGPRRIQGSIADDGGAIGKHNIDKILVQLHPSLLVGSNVCRVDGLVDPYSHTEPMHAFTQHNAVGVYAKGQSGFRESPLCENIFTFDASDYPESRNVFRDE